NAFWPGPMYTLVIYMGEKSSSAPGSKIKKKLGCIDSHSSVRKLATSAVASSPPNEKVIVSPSSNPKRSATSTSTDTPCKSLRVHSSHHCPFTIALSGPSLSLQVRLTSRSMPCSSVCSPLICVSLPRTMG